MVPTEVEATAIRARVKIRHEETAEELAGCPGLSGSHLELVFDLDGRSVRDWDGVERSIHIKACDSGSYDLLGADGEVLASLENEYVPGCLPQECGDYLVPTVGKDGSVSGWTPAAEDIEEAFFPVAGGDQW